MRLSVSMALLLVASAALAKPEITEKTAHRIYLDVRTVLARTETPGATILAIRNGQRVYSHAFGLCDLERGLPAAMDTHYEIGSITKQFTAAAILQLQDDGNLNIDAKRGLGRRQNCAEGRLRRDDDAANEHRR